MATRKKRLTSDARTEQLLDVAAKFFLEKGFEGASVSEIARQAKASKETFYHRYSSKEDLFLAVMRRQTDLLATELNAVLVPDAPTEEALQSFGVVIVGRMISAPSISMHKILSLESSRFPDLPKLFFELGPARVIATLARYLCEQMVLGRLRKMDAELAAQHFLALLTAGTMSRVQLGILPTPTPAQLRRKVQAAVDVFMHGYET
jgi:TetR/AcrR family transcriptional regulator, mexJK operon transcriptional repressor